MKRVKIAKVSYKINEKQATEINVENNLNASHKLVIFGISGGVFLLQLDR